MITRTIEVDGEVAGNMGSWEQDGRQLVGYWLGREFWGRGHRDGRARRVRRGAGPRPLHAWVARSNLGSIRVLEKCGFVGWARGPSTTKARVIVEELLFELR